MSGSINRDTSNMAVAGITFPNASWCARPISLPASNVRDDYTGSNDVIKAGTGVAKTGRNDFDAPLSLNVRVSLADYLAIFADRRGPGYGNVRAYFYCSAVTDDIFPGRA